jgi:hypothetical protein
VIVYPAQRSEPQLFPALKRRKHGAGAVKEECESRVVGQLKPGGQESKNQGREKGAAFFSPLIV